MAPPPSAPRPGRALALVALVVVALSAGLFTGDRTPKLGLDLRGGTSVILEPVGLTTAQVPKSSLTQAVSIIRQRVNSLGVSEADVTTQGGRNIVIAVPGKGRDEVVSLVGRTAQLRFRQVLATEPAGTPPAPAASGSATPAPAATTSPPAGTPKVKPATPAPTATGNGRALASALVAAATPTPTTATTSAPTSAPTTAPSVAASAVGPTPIASPSAGAAGPAATASPSPTGSPAPNAARAAQLYRTATCKQLTALNRKAVDNPDLQLATCDQGGTEKYLLDVAKVVGTDVKGASAALDPTTGTEWLVNVDFTGKGQSKFTKLTQATVGKRVAIVLDAEVISAPNINEAIPTSAQISGGFTQQSASDLANVLKYGSLPLTFKQQSVESVSPTLGDDQLRAGLLAGAIGLGLVVLYSLVYYRGLGLVTIASLLLSGLVIYASTVLLGRTIGYTLSLAGIAGFIVAVGITADSFVVFFERLRDEVRDGRSLRSGVERGWVRARRTILSADAISIIAAAVLYFLSVGAVRGFAFTLGLSTLVDLFVVFLFTKPLVALLARTKLFGGGSAFSGLGRARMGAAEETTAPVRRRRTAPLPVKEA